MASLYDRAMLEVGNDGKFQKKFDLIYNIIFPSLWVMAYFNIALALTITPHTCRLPKRPENITKNEWQAKYIPMITKEETEKYSDCLIYLSTEINETRPCDVFDYDQTWFETTVPSDNNWVCESEINVANILAYSRITEIFGSLFFGWFADVYGRKLTYVISLLMLVTGRLLSLIVSSSFAIFTLGCIFASFPSWSATQSTAVISLEISSAKRRSTIATLRLVATSAGMCILPFFYWWLRSWKLFLIVTTGFQIPYLLFSWKMIESPQWLWINGKPKATLRYLKRIAKINNSTLTQETEGELLTTNPSSTNKSKADVLGPLALFSGWRLTVMTVLQLFFWVAVSANYTVAVMSSGQKSDGNPFLDFAWQSLAEIPGYFIAAWFADRIGRRYTSMIAFSLTSVIWIVHGYLGSGNSAWIKNEVFSTILVIVNRASITVTYYIINLLNMELYPTCLRQSGMSLGNVMCGLASALGHYILYLGRRVDVRYSTAILTATSLVGGSLSTFFLPETLNAKLPETLEDARKFYSFKASRGTSKVTT